MHVLHVRLIEIEPSVWRDLLLPGDATLATLHDAIQAAMPWTNSHLHVFEVGRARFSDPSFEPSPGPEGDENRFTLSDVLPHVGARLTYTYDFGDDWVHEVFVKEFRQSKGRRVRALGGARAAPPEDCGGTAGYERLLHALAHPNHRDHGELTDWVVDLRDELSAYDERFEGEFDPEDFDLRATDRALAKIYVEPRRT